MRHHCRTPRLDAPLSSTVFFIILQPDLREGVLRQESLQRNDTFGALIKHETDSPKKITPLDIQLLRGELKRPALRIKTLFFEALELNEKETSGGRPDTFKLKRKALTVGENLWNGKK